MGLRFCVVLWKGIDLTGWAVVVAGQDCALVVAETLPVVGVAVADSGAGGGEAVGDDAVEIVRRSTLCVREEDRSYASIAVPQPDCESAEAEEVAALDVVD